MQIGPVIFLSGAAGSRVAAGTLVLLKAALLARLCWGVLEGNTWLLASAGKELKDNFLRALVEREEANRDGKLSSIIYIRDYNSRHQEVSAYIDYAYRLTTDDFEAYFSGKKRLLPRKTDLSFYNWNKNVVSSKPSPNYKVIAESACGLLFKNKRDGKIINVNPEVYPGDNTTRTPVKTDLCFHVVIYDHIIGRGP
ncbi:cilia- and flagella-associated protein 299 isoform X2 [Cygnus olor]|uniref:cilia- and flagella-associated protein 299 isoform X2 n=1 Tax=Cygnus olor TaxID=8869 RepID=UPI001ADEA149|nr:cilia- and flagella-associated protein 299 isoform X2 [Cygnus olor]